MAIDSTVPNVNPPSWALLAPKLTDIQDGASVAIFDTIEIPAGTGRFYTVYRADDIAKGFSNEYRIAFISKTLVWPTPYP